MTTIQAIRNVDDELAESLEREGRVLPFTLADPEEDVEKISKILRDGVSTRTETIAETRKELRQTVASLNAEIERLKGQITEAKEGAAKRIAAEEKIVTASRAFLKVAEG